MKKLLIALGVLALTLMVFIVGLPRLVSCEAQRDIPKLTLHVLSADDLALTKRIELDVDRRHRILKVDDTNYFLSSDMGCGASIYEWLPDGSFKPVADGFVGVVRESFIGLMHKGFMQRAFSESDRRDELLPFVVRLGEAEVAVQTDSEMEASALIDYKSKRKLIDLPPLTPGSAVAYDSARSVLYYSTRMPGSPLDLKAVRIVAVDVRNAKVLGITQLKDVGHNWREKDLRHIEIFRMYLTGDGHLLAFAGSSLVEAK